MLTANQFSLVPEWIATSDLITAVPERILSKSAYSQHLHIVELPIEVAPAELQMMWHERMRSLCRSIAEST